MISMSLNNLMRSRGLSQTFNINDPYEKFIVSTEPSQAQHYTGEGYNVPQPMDYSQTVDIKEIIKRSREAREKLQILNKHVFSASKRLAGKVDMKLEYEDEIPLFVQTLKDKGVISDSEWERLSELLLIMNGMYARITYYNEPLDEEDLEVVSEYLNLIQSIIKREETSTFPVYKHAIYHSSCNITPYL